MTIRVLFLLAFLLCSSAPAGAESVIIGSAAVTYAEPKGFVQAGALFPLHLERMDQELDANTVVFAKFVPAAYLSALAADHEALPDWYIHLAYDEYFLKKSLGGAGFAIATSMVGRRMDRAYGKDDFQKTLADMFCEAIGRNVAIDRMTSHGFVEKKGNFRSMLATGHAVVDSRNGPLEFSIATMSSFVLIEGKLITVVQVGFIDSDEDIPRFTRQALERAREMLPGG